MTGRMTLPDAAMFKTILTEDDITAFKIDAICGHAGPRDARLPQYSPR